MREKSKPVSYAQLPKSMVRWILLGLIVSTAVVVIISVFAGVSVTDFTTIGYLPFALAAAASAGGLLLEVLRFRVVTRSLTSSPKVDLRGYGRVKLASQFLALATPSTAGGLILSSAWLSRKGVNGGTAVWIGYFELLIQAYVSSALGLVAAAFAFSKGAMLIGSAITLVVVSMSVGYTLIFLIPSIRHVEVPTFMFRLSARVIGRRRAGHLENVVQMGARNFSLAAAALLRRESIPLIVKAASLTVAEAVLSGIALWLVMASAGLRIDILSSTVVASGAMAITAIPISIGGSGIAEFAMKTYLASVFGFSSWAAVVLWRIASYQVILGISGIAFLIILPKLTERGYARPGTALPITSGRQH